MSGRAIAGKADVIEALAHGRTFADAAEIAGYSEARAFRQRADSFGLRRIKRRDVVIVLDRKAKA